MLKDKNILIIDDEKWNTLLLERFLKDEGFTVTSKTDAREALELTFTEKFFCIILDLQMSILSGFAFIEELKKKDIKINNIIVVSGYISNTQKSNLLEKGIGAIINKPIEFDLLLENILKN